MTFTRLVRRGLLLNPPGRPPSRIQLITHSLTHTLSLSHSFVIRSGEPWMTSNARPPARPPFHRRPRRPTVSSTSVIASSNSIS